jgi:cysteine desulfurase/selenocysteine lyase
MRLSDMDWAAIRQEFPILHQRVKGHPLVYLDNAATSQKPRCVIEALRGYYECDNANVHRGMHELSARATAAYEGARERVAAYLGAGSAEEIVFTRGTTESINLVANVFGFEFLKEGDVILLTEMEHHSNMVPWQLVAQRCRARLKFVPVLDDGVLDLVALDRLIAEGGVKVLAFTHVSNTLGTINPVRDICQRARQAGAVSLVDGAQSAGHVPVNVEELGCDFYAFSGHKMCAPTGIGALYGRKQWLERLPPWQGGGEMISVVRLEGSEFKAPPARFEAGTPNIAGAVGLAAAMDFLDGIGREAIWEHDQQLIQHLMERLVAVPGVRLLGQGPGLTRGAVAAFTAEAAHPHDLVTYADEKGVALRGGHHCNQPLMRRFKVPSTVRASVYFYNTLDEVDRMIDILTEALEFFRGFR